MSDAADAPLLSVYMRAKNIEVPLSPPPPFEAAALFGLGTLFVTARSTCFWSLFQHYWGPTSLS